MTTRAGSLHNLRGVRAPAAALQGSLTFSINSQLPPAAEKTRRRPPPPNRKKPVVEKNKKKQGGKEDEKKIRWKCLLFGVSFNANTKKKNYCKKRKLATNICRTSTKLQVEVRAYLHRMRQQEGGGATDACALWFLLSVEKNTIALKSLRASGGRQKPPPIYLKASQPGTACPGPEGYSGSTCKTSANAAERLVTETEM